MTSATLTEKQTYWHNHLQCCAEQGIGLTDYAKANHLDVHRLYYWKSYLAKKQQNHRAKTESSAPASAFIRAVMKPAMDTRVTFPNGVVIEWTGDLDETVLTMLARLSFVR